MTTPNQLYYETLKKENPIIKDAGNKVQYRLDDMVDQVAKQYIKGN